MVNISLVQNISAAIPEVSTFIVDNLKFTGDLSAEIKFIKKKSGAICVQFLWYFELLYNFC